MRYVRIGEYMEGMTTLVPGDSRWSIGQRSLEGPGRRAQDGPRTVIGELGVYFPGSDES